MADHYLQKKTEVPWVDPAQDPQIELDGSRVEVVGAAHQFGSFVSGRPRQREAFFLGSGQGVLGLGAHDGIDPTWVELHRRSGRMGDVLLLEEQDGVTTLSFSQPDLDREDAPSVGPGWAYYLDRLGADPAVASSVFVTMVTDSMGFLAFLGLATASGLVG